MGAVQGRTLGWVQDAQRLDRCRLVVELVGRFRPITFAELLPLVRERLGVGRWADDNYVRFAHALGFLDYDRAADSFALTELGDALLFTPTRPTTTTPTLFDEPAAATPERGPRLIRESSPEEIEVFGRALLGYPPVMRVLDLLVQSEHRTKFDIGQRLGFVGEEGFTSIPESRYVIAVAREGKAKHDYEGTADKYARCIARWCEQMGWVENVPKPIEVEEGGRRYCVTVRHAYKLTEAGRQAWRRGRGGSTSARVPKRVPIEMLASRALPGAEFVRGRRLLVLEALQRAKGGTTPAEIVAYLHSREVVASAETVAYDLRCLANMGLHLREVGDAWLLRDTVVLDRPAELAVRPARADAVEEVVAGLGGRLRYVAPAFLEVIRQSFDSEREREFEASVEEVLHHLLDFETQRLGGGLQPDVLAWHRAPFPRFSYGIIVDAKAARAGYSVTIESADQMTRYVREWERRLLREHEIPRAYFLFVSSAFRGTLQGLQTIKERTQVDGAAITARNLLYLAERMRAARHRVDHRAVQTLLGSGGEITEAMIDALG